MPHNNSLNTQKVRLLQNKHSKYMKEQPKKRKVRFTVNLTEQEQFAFMRRVNALTGVDMSEWRVIKDD